VAFRLDHPDELRPPAGAMGKPTTSNTSNTEGLVAMTLADRGVPNPSHGPSLTGCGVTLSSTSP
jgi:hypothetical protein